MKKRYIALGLFLIYMLIGFIGLIDVIYQLGIHNPEVVVGELWNDSVNAPFADIILIIGGFVGAFISLVKVYDPSHKVFDI